MITESNVSICKTIELYRINILNRTPEPFIRDIEGYWSICLTEKCKIIQIIMERWKKTENQLRDWLDRIDRIGNDEIDDLMDQMKEIVDNVNEISKTIPQTSSKIDLEIRYFNKISMKKTSPFLLNVQNIDLFDIALQCIKIPIYNLKNLKNLNLPQADFILETMQHVKNDINNLKEKIHYFVRLVISF